MYAPEVYAKADELLRQRIKEGVFVKDTEEIYYLYELTMNGRSQTGLVACASIDDYKNNVIKKHEKTPEEALYRAFSGVLLQGERVTCRP